MWGQGVRQDRKIRWWSVKMRGRRVAAKMRANVKVKVKVIVEGEVQAEELRPREGTQKSQLDLKGVAAKGSAAMRKTKQSDSEQTEPASSKRAWKGIDMNLVDPDDLPPRSRLFVQGKVEQITEDFLQRNFEVFGSLDYIKLLIKSGQRQGKAYVKFRTAAAAETALETVLRNNGIVDDDVLGEVVIEVVIAKPRRRRTKESGARTFSDASMSDSAEGPRKAGRVRKRKPKSKHSDSAGSDLDYSSAPWNHGVANDRQRKRRSAMGNGDAAEVSVLSFGPGMLVNPSRQVGGGAVRLAMVDANGVAMGAPSTPFPQDDQNLFKKRLVVHYKKGTAKKALKKLFGRYRGITSCVMHNDAQCVFVSFHSEEAAATVRNELHGAHVQLGSIVQTLRVDFAIRAPSSASMMRYKRKKKKKPDVSNAWQGANSLSELSYDQSRSTKNSKGKDFRVSKGGDAVDKGHGTGDRVGGDRGSQEETLATRNDAGQGVMEASVAAADLNSLTLDDGREAPQRTSQQGFYGSQMGTAFGAPRAPLHFPTGQPFLGHHPGMYAATTAPFDPRFSMGYGMPVHMFSPSPLYQPQAFPGYVGPVEVERQHHAEGSGDGNSGMHFVPPMYPPHFFPSYVPANITPQSSAAAVSGRSVSQVSSWAENSASVNATGKARNAKRLQERSPKRGAEKYHETVDGNAADVEDSAQPAECDPAETIPQQQALNSGSDGSKVSESSVSSTSPNENEEGKNGLNAKKRQRTAE
eukprot:g5151.t1